MPSACPLASLLLGLRLDLLIPRTATTIQPTLQLISRSTLPMDGGRALRLNECASKFDPTTGCSIYDIFEDMDSGSTVS